MISLFVVLFFTAFLLLAGYLIWSWQRKYEKLQEINRHLLQQFQSVQNREKEKQEQMLEQQQLLQQYETGVLVILPVLSLLGGRDVLKGMGAVLHIVQTLLKAPGCGFYEQRDGIYHLISGLDMPERLTKEAAAYFHLQALPERLFILKQAGARPDDPALALPVVIRGELRYMLIVQQLELLRLTDVNMKLLGLLLELLAECVEQAEDLTVWKNPVNKLTVFKEVLTHFLQYVPDWQAGKGTSVHRRRKYYEEQLAEKEAQLSSLSSDSYLSLCRVCEQYINSGTVKLHRLRYVYTLLRDTADRATEYFPAQIAFHDYVVYVYLQTGKQKRAFERATRMTQQFPHRPEGYMRLLEYYFSAGEFSYIPDLHKRLTTGMVARDVPASFQAILAFLQQVHQE